LAPVMNATFFSVLIFLYWFSTTPTQFPCQRFDNSKVP
jgi:hypothetical protein